MPYEHLEELRGRKGEKIVLFLTVENLVGIVLVSLPIYLATTSTPFVLRLGLLGLSATIGYLLTVEIGGLTAYERVGWLLRGLLRRQMLGSTLTPEQLAGSAQTLRGQPITPLDGPIRRAAPRTIRLSPVALSDDGAARQHEPDVITPDEELRETLPQ